MAFGRRDSAADPVLHVLSLILVLSCSTIVYFFCFLNMKTRWFLAWLAVWLTVFVIVAGSRASLVTVVLIYRDCFEDTEWKLFFDACEDVHETTDTITSYIRFCDSNCVKTKTIQVYSNSGLLYTKIFKMCLNEKKVKDKELIRDKRKEFRGLIRKAKLVY